MGNGRTFGKLTEEQLERAKCKKSPTKAHHFMLESSPRTEKAKVRGRCKYCGEKRTYGGDWRWPTSSAGKPFTKSPKTPAKKGA